MPEPRRRPGGEPAARRTDRLLATLRRSQQRAVAAAAPDRPDPSESGGRRTAGLEDGTGASAPTGAGGSSPLPSPGSSPLPSPGGSTGGSAWVRFRRVMTHPGRGQILAAVLLFVLGMAGVMQVRLNRADDAYTSARREDLIQLLDGLGSESQRLESEISDLERTRRELQSGADTQQVARAEARQRVEQLSILAGATAAEGPGIRMQITVPSGKLDPDVLLDAVEEMRDAGAEVIELNDRVRVVASTWFGSDAAGLVVDGQSLTGVVTLEVIGDPHSLEEAARFRGGLVSEITGPRIGGQVRIDREPRLVVTSLHAAADHQYAQPASPPPTPR